MRVVALIILMLFASFAFAEEEALNSAFQEGKNFGGSINEGAASGINTGNVQDKIPLYGTQPTETQFFQGGQGELSGHGVTKMQMCTTASPDPDPIKRQECEAINFLAKNPQIRPQFNIDKNDSMFLKAKNIENNAESFFKGFGMSMGNSTQCTTKTETIPAQYTTETCSSLKEVGEQQCTMGRIINIDVDSNFQCEQTINAYETLKCRRSSVVTCTGGGVGCAPSGIKSDSVLIYGFGRFLVHPIDGSYWFVSAGTINPDGSYSNNAYFRGNYYDVFQSDIYFDIVNKSTIATFFLNQILYDDNIAVWLNGNLIFHSTGGTDFSICNVDQNGMIKGVNDGVHGCVRTYFEGGRDYYDYGGFELKNYLIEGRNHVRIKVVIGSKGDAIVRFKTLAYCPPNCSVQTNNQCASLEARAK
jgi:hypothetical protein